MLSGFNTVSLQTQYVSFCGTQTGITRRIIVWQWWTDSCGGPEAEEECAMAHGLASALSDRQTDRQMCSPSHSHALPFWKSTNHWLPGWFWQILNVKCHFRLPYWLILKDGWTSSCLLAVSCLLSSYRNPCQSWTQPSYHQFTWSY